MARHIHSIYFEDNYLKYDCNHCKRSFILGETLSKGQNLACPYCQSGEIEIVAAATDDFTEDMDMGCLGLYFLKDDSGTLLLFTDKEFAGIARKYSGAGFASLMDAAAEYSMKRDALRGKGIDE